MGIDHSNPYIHSTTVLCDTELPKHCIRDIQLVQRTFTSIVGIIPFGVIPALTISSFMVLQICLTCMSRYPA